MLYIIRIRMKWEPIFNIDANDLLNMQQNEKLFSISDLPNRLG